ncbi:clathrin interactor lqfR isoform X2 [Dermatophagoides pteronyssinus]|uniref:clathrin interactor lqfR isoform X2 n=1 Tax=Dermatophagoides pteronyssinus TaxID=6956 RepID=UPI003F6712A4
MNVMWKVRDLYDKATNIIMNYTEVEAKVREATNDEAWGPTGRQMQEIAQHTFTYEYYPEVMNMLWKRMIQENMYNWRRTYKSLQLLNYLVINGSERVVTSAREHIYDLRRLENYTFIDELGKDQGINVRQRAKLIIELIQDDEKIRQERKKAKQYKDKFVGVSNQSSYSDRDRDSWSDSPRKSDGPYDGGFKDEIEQQPKRYDDAQNDSDHSRPSSPPKAKAAIPVENKNNNNQQPAKQRTTRNIKKIDLGAAALYAQEHANNKPAESNSTANADLFSVSPTSDSQTKTADLLGDLFGGLTVTGPTSFEQAKDEEFADFSQFVGPSIPNSEPNLSGNKQLSNNNTDDFADFQSAFDSPTPLNVNVQPVPTSNVVDLLGATSSSNPSESASFAAMNPFLVAPIEPPKSPFNTLSLLTPVTANNHSNSTVQQTANKSEDSSCSSSSLKIGETWSGLNTSINFDNILDLKNSKPAAPTINQLAQANNQQRLKGTNVQSPSGQFLPSFGFNNSLSPTTSSAPMSPVTDNHKTDWSGQNSLI